MDYNNKLFNELSSKNLVGIKVSFEDEGLDFIDVLNIKKFYSRQKLKFPLVLLKDLSSYSTILIEPLTAT